jgi:hypothetical protein
MRDYLEHLRAKPEQERQHIAFGVAAGVTLVVAAGWLTALVSSDVLALDSGEVSSLEQAAEGTKNDFSNLLGAASAFQSAVTEGVSAITAVETNTSSTLETDTQTEATVIPF